MTGLVCFIFSPHKKTPHKKLPLLENTVVDSGQRADVAKGLRSDSNPGPPPLITCSSHKLN